MSLGFGDILGKLGDAFSFDSMFGGDKANPGWLTPDSALGSKDSLGWLTGGADALAGLGQAYGAFEKINLGKEQNQLALDAYNQNQAIAKQRHDNQVKYNYNASLPNSSIRDQSLEEYLKSQSYDFNKL